MERSREAGRHHPVAYVALGSHANYFTNTAELDEVHGVPQVRDRRRDGDTIAKLAQEQIVDRTGTAHPLGPTGLPE